MNSIYNEIKSTFRQGSMLNRLLYINLGFFLIYKLVVVFLFLLKMESIQMISNLGVSSNFEILKSKPWTLITYMFFHKGFLHLLVNLMWLFFGGKIFLRYLSNKQLMSTYVLGGISGVLFYILAFNYLPAFEGVESIAIGASASVLAILLAIATYVPNYQVELTFVGRVKLKQIAIFSIVLDILLIPQGNAGGHIAHLGGAFYGYIFAKQLKNGKDVSKWFDQLITYLSNIIKRKSAPLKTVHKRAKNDDQWRKEKVQTQEQINLILEKISKSGYESLSKEEKDTLFKASKK